MQGNSWLVGGGGRNISKLSFTLCKYMARCSISIFVGFFSLRRLGVVGLCILKNDELKKFYIHHHIISNLIVLSSKTLNQKVHVME